MLPPELSPLYPKKDLSSAGPLVVTSGDEMQNKESGFASEEDDDEDVRRIGTKKRHRRGKTKKRKWKPYYKLSWQERRELEERETERANHLRESMFAHGQPVAPYNTTQFLMEDHNVQEPNFAFIPNIQKNQVVKEGKKAAAGSSEEFYSSPEDEDFLQRQFSEVYEDVHAERLNAMSKGELVVEYMQLEERVERLERELKECRSKKRTTLIAPHEALDRGSHDGETITCHTLEETVQRLREENDSLRCENQLLRTMAIHGAP